MTADPLPTEHRDTRLRWVAVVVILAVTALRIGYLFYYCPYDLAPDEAHYWDWSRHLDWSYYSKGPLIAWIIRAGCEFFGDVAVATQGTLMPAVRLPAVLCGSGMLAALYILTFQTFRSDRLALAVMLVALSMPAFAVCSVIMTIDAPFLCCWAWALVVGRMALVDGKSWAWPVAGMLIALGILAKYTMALWLFSAGLFVLFTPTHRGLIFRPGFWVMVLTVGLSAVPILVWNSQHDWVTFRHVAVQAGVAEGKKAVGIRWLGPLVYAGGQAGLLLGFWFLVWVAALYRYRPRAGVSPGVRYLWWMSVPTFAVFAASSVRASGQINWPVAAYMSGSVLVGGWLAEALGRKGWWCRAPRWVTILLRIAMWVMIVVGVTLTLIAHDSRPLMALVAPHVRPDSPDDAIPMRKFDPTARLKGHRLLGTELDALRAAVRATDGVEPVLAGTRWDLPGQIGFYSEGHPPAYAIGRLLRLDRHSQYDIWRPNPVDDAQAFHGKTFLVVCGIDPRPFLKAIFDTVEPAHEVVYQENGRVVAKWFICVGRGYRDVDPALRIEGEVGH